MFAVWSGKCAACSINVWCALYSVHCVVWSVQLSGSSSIFVKNKHQKAANLELQLILAARMGYTESFEMWSI